jgi:cyanate permease
MLTFDWRIALRVFAIGVPIFALPVIWFGIIKTPKERGLNPDGDASQPEDALDAGAEEETEWTLPAAIRNKTVWRLALIMGPGFMGISAVLLSLHSHLTDSGLSAMRASSVVAAMTFAGAIAKPLFGILSDYFSKQWVTFASIVFMFFGVAGIITSTHFSLVLLAAASFGLGYGAQMPLFNILIATLFGQRSFARMVGIMGPVMLPFNLLGLPMSTWIYESFGSYTPAYAFMLGLYVVAMISLATFKLPSR